MTGGQSQRIGLARAERALDGLRALGTSRSLAGWVEALEEAITVLGGAGACLEARPWGASVRAAPRRSRKEDESFLPFGVVSLPRCGCPGTTSEGKACDLRGRLWRVGVRLRPKSISSRRRRELEAFGAEVVNVLRGLALHHILGAAAPAHVDEVEAVFVLDGPTGALRAASTIIARLQPCALGPGEEPLASLLATLGRQTFERRAPQRAVTPTLGGSITVQSRALDDVVSSVVLYVTRRARPPEPQATSFGLTARETQVAERVTRGETNREVARALGVSPATVKVHLANIYAKTGLQGRTELAGLLLGGGRPSWTEDRAPRVGRARRAAVRAGG